MPKKKATRKYTLGDIASHVTQPFSGKGKSSKYYIEKYGYDPYASASTIKKQKAAHKKKKSAKKKKK